MEYHEVMVVWLEIKSNMEKDYSEYWQRAKSNLEYLLDQFRSWDYVTLTFFFLTVDETESLEICHNYISKEKDSFQVSTS